jgi:hypothetical protein
MIKASTGWIDEREAHGLVFGLSEGNLRRLDENAPIFIKSSDLNLDPQILGFVIFRTSDDEETLKNDLEVVSHQFGIKLNEQVSVMNIEESFYVIPVTFEEGIFYIMGLHDKSYELLRAQKLLTFRARIPECKAQSVEVTLFWGETEEQMAEQLKASAR